MQFRIIRYEQIGGESPPQIRPPEARKIRYAGAGDLVAAVAHPIAGVLDRVFGMDLQADCKGCAERQKWLNEAIPFPLRPPPPKC